jgi:glycerol-3-phosphate dehydrogenase
MRPGVMPSQANHELVRDEQIARLKSETFDIAVIGGGINGAAIARDAAMRGLRVALIDKGDFAGATSSRSSKLIHGGLRYLPQGRPGLVYAALRERERLRHVTAPHLVHPLRFLFPFYRGQHPGRFAVSAGLILYDLLARMPRAERHQRLGNAAVHTLEPSLKEDGLNGGALYYDAWADDARLTLENALDAACHGAAVANYVALEAFSPTRQRIGAAAVRDMVGGGALELRSRIFVNAAGPWVDDVRRMDDPAADRQVRLTKGVHLVIHASRLPAQNVLVLADDEGRIVFVMPRDSYVIIGTTDTDFDGDRDKVAADVADVDYLLGVVAQSMPELKLREDDIAYSFAGLRALVASPGLAPSAVSREEVILESPSGLFSVAGGKLTTHRAIADKLVDRAMKKLGRPAGKCPTLGTPLPGARPSGEGASSMNGLEPDAFGILVRRYGTRAEIVARIARSKAELAQPLAPGCPAIGAEVVHAIRNEFALSVSDFIVRRTSLVWRAPAEAVEAAPAVARIMAAELGWDRPGQQAQLDAFLRIPGLWVSRGDGYSPGAASERTPTSE